MHLINPLVGGIPAAVNGTAYLYRRGTSTLTTYYDDFEGSQAHTGGTVQLDSYGAAIVYVNETVNVVVKVGGATVAEFVAGASASAIEYSGTGATGVNYETGQSAVSQPITEQAFFDRWAMNNGKPDWKVTDTFGTARTVRSAAMSLSGSWINVRDPAYGATGDGTTDDLAAFVAAVAAAAAGPGIVFVPAGTYRFSDTLTLTAGVSLVGCGQLVTIFKMDNDGASTLSLPSGTYRQWVEGIRFTNAQSNNYTYVTPASGAIFGLRDCYFTGTNCTNDLVYADHGDGIAENCWFALVTGIRAYYTEIGRAVLTRCTFVTPATYSCSNGIVTAANGTTAGDMLVVEDCDFSVGSSSSGTFNGVYAKIGSITGCTFRAAGGATWVPFYIPTFAAATNFHESGNVFEAGITAPYTLQAVNELGVQCFLGSRIGRYKRHGTVNADVMIHPEHYGTIYLTRTNDTAMVITFGDAPNGTHCTVCVFNNRGAAATITAMTTATNVEHDFDGTLADQFTLILDCVAFVGLDGACHWVCKAKEASV